MGDPYTKRTAKLNCFGKSHQSSCFIVRTNTGERESLPLFEQYHEKKVLSASQIKANIGKMEIKKIFFHSKQVLQLLIPIPLKLSLLIEQVLCWGHWQSLAHWMCGPTFALRHFLLMQSEETPKHLFTT